MADIACPPTRPLERVTPACAPLQAVNNQSVDVACGSIDPLASGRIADAVDNRQRWIADVFPNASILPLLHRPFAYAPSSIRLLGPSYAERQWIRLVGLPHSP